MYPQTVRFCKILVLTDLVKKFLGISTKFESSVNLDEIQLNDDSGDRVSSSINVDTSGCNVFFIGKIGTHSDSKPHSMRVRSASRNFSFPEMKN